jgi:ABC-type transport system involved in cytochrome bd biosynthesis fused ATPase/permease subunit
MESVQKVVLGVLQPLMQATTSAIIATVIVAFLVLIDPLAAVLSAMLVGATYGAVIALSRRRLIANSKVLAGSATRRMKLIQEGLGAIRDILVDGSQGYFEDRFNKADKFFRGRQAENAFIASAPRFVAEAASVIALSLVLLALSARAGEG